MNDKEYFVTWGFYEKKEKKYDDLCFTLGFGAVWSEIGF